MKKNILVLILILIFFGVGFYFWQMSQIKPEIKPTPVELPNPASFYCEGGEGELEMRTLADGSQRGFCLFDDGSECDEWQFFRGECEKGNIFCKNLCGDGICQEVVCLAVGCPCAETPKTCPEDCL
ncbi:MAG: DUF333 domain-containing protein [Candidatus Nealsonbacteria bacterium]|nr:DUF333 domain-containing protein [Candidatus Nealsonbacteria bacterium]